MQAAPGQGKSGVSAACLTDGMALLIVIPYLLLDADIGLCILRSQLLQHGGNIGNGPGADALNFLFALFRQHYNDLSAVVRVGVSPNQLFSSI